MKKKTIIILVILIALIVAIAAYFIFQKNQVSFSPPVHTPKEFPSDPRTSIMKCWVDPVTNNGYPLGGCYDSCLSAYDSCQGCCNAKVTSTPKICDDFCQGKIKDCITKCNNNNGQ